MEKTHEVETRLTSPEIRDDLDAVWKPLEAAKFLSVSDRALADWRRAGVGPKFIRLSPTRVGYRKRSLLEWLEAREKSSTSAEQVGHQPEVSRG